MSKTIREQRFEKVLQEVSNHNIKTILEIGCGDGKFVPYIKTIKNINKITVIDKDEKKIARIKRKHEDIESHCVLFEEYCLHCEPFDCVVAIEVMEHLSNKQLKHLQKVVFGRLKPQLVVFTTPNIEYNINYPILHNGLRHSTHLFEFSPKQLYDWGNVVVKKYNDYIFYTGFCDEFCSSQIICFTRRERL